MKNHHPGQKAAHTKKVELTGLISVSSKGVGYISLPDTDDDIEIQPERLHTAFNGDEVSFRLVKDKRLKRPQGEITTIIKRAKTQFVGVITREQGRYFLLADDKKVYKPITITNGDTYAKNLTEPGTKALVRITRWPEVTNPEGEIVEIIGKKGVHDVEMKSIVLEKGFDYDYPEDVVKEAELIEKTEKPIPEDEIKKRRDFRQTLTFTIDPVDAKDFDDAISFKKIADDQYEIGVHIADVSHYVRERTALDREAAKRGFSVYLVDRTIPMLPEVLSNDICSLNPNEDRLTFSAVFIMNGHGVIRDRWFGKTIIHSHKRFSYEEAQGVLDAKSGQYHEELAMLNQIARRLAEDKFAAGAIDFEKDEVKFKLDANGKPIEVYKKARLETHRLVEDYMLLANREVAEFIFRENRDKKRKEGAFIYRVHDLPDPERIADLTVFMKALGFELESHEGRVSSKAIRRLLDQVTGSPNESLIKTAAIRSMAKAIYSTHNIGHFGLAFKHYTHFTSPIRRYADLLVHRVLFAYIQNRSIPDAEMKYYFKMADKTTQREIQAAEAERASIKYKQVEYMSERVGQEFEGVISGVTEWGIYIEEVNTRCEGMVKLRDLTDDFYIHDEKNYALVGEKSKRKFVLGDKVKFKVVNADLERKTLDYKLV